MNVYAWTFDGKIGYGRSARSLLHCLSDVQFWIDSPNSIPEDLKPFHRKFKRPDIAMLAPHMDTTAPVQFTMFESTLLPEHMVRNLAKRKLIIVPCEQNAVAFTSSGLKNVKVCNLAVTPCFALMPPKQPMTFIHVASDSGIPERKRSAEVVAAFVKAFPSQDDVRLIVKKAPEDKRIICFDSRVELIYEWLPDLGKLYSRAHVGVFLCGQEAWGYSQADLLSIGRPIITPFYGGPADYCIGNCCYSLPYTMKPTPKKTFGKVGLCARADTKALVHTLRFCYENFDDVVLKGVHGYRRMLGFSHKTMAARLGELL